MIATDNPPSRKESFGLPDDVAESYVALRRLPDERIIGVRRLMFHWTLHVDIDAFGIADRYCFETGQQALAACLSWDGEGDPGFGWHRHPGSGRRRPGGAPAREYLAA